MPARTSPLKHVAFIGGYAPRRCGIATFTTDLHEAVSAAAPESDCFVVAVTDHLQNYEYGSAVRFELDEKDAPAYRRTADFLNLNGVEVLSLQHEFGIFGGPSGSYLLALLREVQLPVVTTLHTILSTPDIAQRKVMDEIVRRSDRLVVMAERGKAILTETYSVCPERIDVIPHGIPDVKFSTTSPFKQQLGIEDRLMILTFGLLGHGKGIEHAIRALPAIVAKHPEVVYVVLGATHPHLLAHEGERYRLSLERLAEDCGVKEHVIFHNRFVSQVELMEFISAADVYLSPYPNEAQITSGTLAQAFGAGTAVVSTAYWHAQELLADDRGILVAARDPDAISEGINRLLGDPDHMLTMRKRAYELGRTMIWPEVARLYLESFSKARASRPYLPRAAFSKWTIASRYELPSMRLDHLYRMTDRTGMLQHALYSIPNHEHGYCTDDNARALILSCIIDEHRGSSLHRSIEELMDVYLGFLASALDETSGRFRNFMTYDRRWHDEEGSEDCHGRALWALGTLAGRSRIDSYRLLSGDLFKAALDAAERLKSPRAWATALLGINQYLQTFQTHRRAHEIRLSLVERLMQLWVENSDPSWPWFETSLSYDNARICQALIECGRLMPHAAASQAGITSLKWLSSLAFVSPGHFRPVGSDGFYPKGGIMAAFDQQPLEAQAMVAACLTAWVATADPMWQREARRAFEWFLGRNDLGLPLYDPRTGGCCDGLHPDRVNSNQGAESTLAFLHSLLEMQQAGLEWAKPAILPPVTMLERPALKPASELQSAC